MPMKPTGQIVFNSTENGKKEALNESIRTHLVAIYQNKIKTNPAKTKGVQKAK
jgi:hypothetical protein